MNRNVNICVSVFIFAVLLSVCTCVAFGDQAVYKTFDQMSRDEKQRALCHLIEEGTVLSFIRAGGGTYQLNEGLWYEKGIIVYGDTAAINAFVQTTASSNFKDGRYRYWGYDINGGLYGNDDFPRDSDSGIPSWQKNWLAIEEIRLNSTARGYVGQFAMNSGFSESLKWDTAKAFLDSNPQFRQGGMDEQFILDHFYFNAVISEEGLTNGQFIGVHISRFDNRLYYQTFSVSVATRLFVVPPPEEPSNDGEQPVIPEEDLPCETMCSLSLPAFTYEGHPVLALDASLFTFDGEIWSASRTYENNLASNRFSAVSGGRVSRISPIRAEAVFNDCGSYQVRLTVCPNGGGELHDIKEISVLPTPAITHSLTGTRKQNRKQVLNVDVAAHPNYPIEEVQIKLMCPSTGETVTLYREHSENGDTIKTRPVEFLSSDEYSESLRLEFLTKNSEPRDYCYYVYVKDSRGHEDSISVDFSVVPDLPPFPAINMESFFIREEGSDKANIIVEDGTVTDGDQINRGWYYLADAEESETPCSFSDWEDLSQMEGYKDLSFGTGKKVQFNREGVGPFLIGLRAEDVWTEGTLKEYITEGDYLAAEAVGGGDVINIAPRVSLSPVRRQPMDITVLTGGSTEYDHAIENRGLLEQNLLAFGIDPKIRIEKMSPASLEPQGTAAEFLMEADTPFGYEGGWTFYENRNFIVDDEKLYKIDAAWEGAGSGIYPGSPYTISCFEARTGGQVFSTAFDDDFFAVPDNGPYLAQDEQGRYLFFISAGRTLIISKDNGSILTALDFETGNNITVGKESIYCIKNDGIYRVNMQTGGIDKIYNGKSSGVIRTIEGRVHFLGIGGTTLYRGIFDPDKELVTLERLLDEKANSGQSSFKALGIDTTGKLIVNVFTPQGTSYISETRIYGRDNKMIRSVSMQDSSSYTYTVTPVYSASGICSYVAYTYDSRSGSYYYGNARLFAVDSDCFATLSVSDKEGYPTNTDQVIFARELDGKVYLATGAEWCYILYTGSYNNGPAHGLPERTKVFVFDPSNDSGSMGTVDQLGMNIVTREYGLSSDSLSAIQTGNNHIGLTYGNETIVTTWAQDIYDVLERCVNRYLHDEKGRGALIIYDETNPRHIYSEDLLGFIGERAESKNCRLIMADRFLIEDSLALANEITAAAEEGANVLGIYAETDGGSISRALDLLADTTYYYEYEVKRADGEISDSFSFIPSINGSSVKPSGFQVISSHFESFDGGDINTFFTLDSPRIHEGVYKGGNVCNRQGSNWSNRYFSDSSVITFDIPRGHKAVLSFDWETYMDSQALWTASFAEINGEMWHEFTPDYKGEGSYCHPFLLSEGKNALKFYARAYGGKETVAKMWIDNLRLDILAPGAAEDLPLPETLSIEPLSLGFNLIKGSFRTPMPSGAYREINEAEIIEGSLGAAPYTSASRWDPGDKEAKYAIPLDKTAVMTLLSTSSRPVVYNDRGYNVTYSWGGYSWYCCPRNDYPESARNNIPSDYRIPLPAMAGTQTFKMKSSDYRGATGSITGIESILVGTSMDSIKDMRFFISDQGMGKRAYLETDIFGNRGDVGLALPRGESFLKNLNIYTYQNGSKVYAVKEAFSDPAAILKWQAVEADAAIIKGTGIEDCNGESLIYKKGETVDFNISYYDYEGDPSKKQYWKYTHTPGNDGPHPEASVVLDEQDNPVSITDNVLSEPIKTFYIDGKYTVEHWQEDNTKRPPTPYGNPDYDKCSNVEIITFYIEGGGTGPWIESIRTVPSAVIEGSDYEIEVRVNDAEKDVLDLKVEVYKERRLLFSYNKQGIAADSGGFYAPVLIPSSFPALPGSYEIICTVKDEDGTGMGSMRFAVLSAGKITGSVSHTDLWDDNRKKYNLFYFLEEYNQESDASYIKTPVPRKRGINVFWPGERFLLRACAAGDPESVTVTIADRGDYKAVLEKTGERNQKGESLYKGVLWDPSMRYLWGVKDPKAITFNFVANYGAFEKSDDVFVIMDGTDEYWQLHRLF